MFLSFEISVLLLGLGSSGHQNKKDLKLLESIQRRDMRMVRDLEGPYEEWLRALGVQLEKRGLGGPHCSPQLPPERQL